MNNKMQLLFGEETAANVMADGGASSSLMKKTFQLEKRNTSQKYLENTDKAKLSFSRIMKPNEDSEKSQ